MTLKILQNQDIKQISKKTLRSYGTPLKYIIIFYTDIVPTEQNLKNIQR